MRVAQELLVDGWLRAVWEAASDAIAISDRAGIVLAANPAYYALYGLAPEDVLGESFAAIFPEHERTTAEAQYRLVFHGPSSPPPFEAIVHRSDGTQRIVRSRISFVEDAGERAAMLSIVRDVTEEVEARRAAERAEDAQRAFLSSVSHDIKSPLAVIMGHAQILRRHIDRRGEAPSVDRLVAGLKQIETSSLQVAEIVDELLEISRLAEEDGPSLHLSPMDLLTLVREVLVKHQRVADHHQLVLESMVDALPGTWDARRLERVLDNLLSNALKYSPDGGTVTVSVSLQGRPIVHAGAGNANAGAVVQTETHAGALLTVTDHGIGIVPEDLPHVFERFRRGGNAATGIPGSGVGLTSVREIVEQHGGTVGIESLPGAGTVVSLWLPLRPDGPPIENSPCTPGA